MSGGFRVRIQQAATVLATLVALAACGTSSMSSSTHGGMMSGTAQQNAAEANPDLDPGSSLGGTAAPDFRLTNQFGQQISLSAFRGKVVILAFTDSECTTVCPLTTVSMLEAKRMLGRAGQDVQLLGVDANPDATAVSDVMAYSRSHAMVNQWDFLTGSLTELHAAWKAYHIYVQIQSGQVDHTPALFVINQRGQEEEVYLTTMAYANVGQEAQILANEVSKLLPGHPRPASERSLSYISGISPKTRATLPAGEDAGPGSITLGPGRPRLVVFFATWLTETSDLRGELLALNSYVQDAKRRGLPALTAVDETVIEPSAAAVRGYLAGLGQPLQYPVALDETGRLADGYGVQDQPWLVLVSASGKIVWSHDGWVTLPALEAAASRS
ncbi:MAG TPA: redoxin domain-containing protein [Streptosporangiaceae bacterium]|nr:redoxin domain-containing protein [Streptosporangiaceae bacterium]